MSIHLPLDGPLRAVKVLLISGVAAGGIILGPITKTTTASAQTTSTAAEELPILVVTPYLGPSSIDRSGTAVTIVGRDQIDDWGSKSVADVLRGTPGLDVTENGGPGSLSNVSLRGSNPGQTLILIDGMRIGDPSNIDGSFDFSTLSTHDIERIEVLRGPQSALYGSDAMGGVVNIITRKGARKPKTALSVEAGSYGTVSTSLSTSGSTEKLSYAFSIQGFHADGFSRYGYRIGRITSQFGVPLEKDKTDKTGASAKVAYRPAPGTEIEIGFRTYSNAFQFDNPGAFTLAAKDTPINKGRQNVTLGYLKISRDMFNGQLKNSLRIYGTETNRFNRLEQSCYDPFFNSYDCEVRFKSQRTGIDYQGDLKLGRFGLLVFGAKSAREQASSTERWIAPPMLPTTTFSGSQTVNSIFALHQLDFGRLSVSLGGRVDSILGKQSFPTWRITTAYSIPETGTKLRASVGTGAKLPTLFQRFSIYGNANLKPEQNLSYEIGLDQDLWNGRAKLSITAFDTQYQNLLGFDPTLNMFIGGYYNVGRARIKGIETSTAVVLVPNEWRMRAAYTYLYAEDSTTKISLLRRPKHKGYVSLIYSGIPKMKIESRVTFVGSRSDIDNDTFLRTRMAPFAKLDGRMSYTISDNVTLFARLENITNARYQEIRDFGVAGRSFFAGAKITW